MANLARRLEALETKKPSPVNQVSPNQFPTPGCTYCQVMNHVFEECPMFQAQQQYHEPMNAAFQGRTIILTHQRTILAGEITLISHGAKITMTIHDQIMLATSLMPIILPIINLTFSISIIILLTIHLTFQTINRTFPTKLHNPPSRILN